MEAARLRGLPPLEPIWTRDANSQTAVSQMRQSRVLAQKERALLLFSRRCSRLVLQGRQGRGSGEAVQALARVTIKVYQVTASAFTIFWSSTANHSTCKNRPAMLHGARKASAQFRLSNDLGTRNARSVLPVCSRCWTAYRHESSHRNPAVHLQLLPTLVTSAEWAAHDPQGLLPPRTIPSCLFRVCGVLCRFSACFGAVAGFF